MPDVLRSITFVIPVVLAAWYRGFRDGEFMDPEDKPGDGVRRL